MTKKQILVRIKFWSAAAIVVTLGTALLVGSNFWMFLKHLWRDWVWELEQLWHYWIELRDTAK